MTAAPSREDPLPREGRLKLSVVIVAYEGYSDLRACLESIDRYNDLGDQLEVIVVEQSPSDEGFRKLRGEFNWVISIRAENRGFGAGNNLGASRARSDLLLFLNPDTILVEPVFEFAAERFASDAGLGLFGLRLRDEAGRNGQSFYPINTTALLSGFIWRVCDRIDAFMPSRMYITGADMFVRRKAFDQAGQFDERFFLYYEEIDLCSRLRLAGWTVRFFPQRSIVHLEGRSTQNTRVSQHRINSLVTLARKQGRSPAAALAHWKRSTTFKLLVRWNCVELRELRRDLSREIDRLSSDAS